MNIGIIGNGFVGKSTYVLKNDNVNIISYDINPELCSPKGTTLNELNRCDIVFISVPTPMKSDGSVCTSIVESVVSSLNDIDYKGFIVVRSTVLPGTCDRINVYFMPEFLTEKNFMDDFKHNELWVYGLLNNKRDHLFKNCVITLLNYAYEANCITSINIEWMLNKEAEMVKYFRNTFLSLKVSYCNEIYQYCKHKGIDYDKMSKVAAKDKRIGLSHTSVPGHDGKFGYGGTCFPKDTKGLLMDMVDVGMDSYILKASIDRNENHDRVEKDWTLDKGRAVM